VSNGAAVGYKAEALGAFTSTTIYADTATLAPQLGNASPFSLVCANNRAVRTSGSRPSVSAGARAVAATFMHTA
jgi:hypothetical protein